MKHRLRLASRAAAAIAFAATTPLFVARPMPVLACSCVQFEMEAAAESDDQAVFVGTVRGAPVIGANTEGRATVDVDGWFHGRGAAATVTITGRFTLQGGGACEVPPPQAGTRYLFVAFVPPHGGGLGVSSCTPHERLQTPAGQALLREAVAVFGAPKPVAEPSPGPTSAIASPTPPPTDPGPAAIAPVAATPAVAEPAPPAPPAAAPSRSSVPAAAVLAGAVGAGIGLFAVLVLIARRRDRARPGL